MIRAVVQPFNHVKDELKSLLVCPMRWARTRKVPRIPGRVPATATMEHYDVNGMHVAILYPKSEDLHLKASRY